MTCFKGETEVHKFEGIAEEVIPVVCLYGNNAGVTVTKIESSGAGNLSGKTVKIKGDRVFYHFPINAGYMVRNSNTWKKDEADWVVIGNNSTRVKRKGDKSGPTSHYSEIAIESGRHYYEVRFGRIAEGKKV